MLFLAFVVAVAGGVARDVLIGAVPQQAIANWHGFAIAIASGLTIFLAYPLVGLLSLPVMLLDATGLALFAVTGAAALAPDAETAGSGGSAPILSRWWSSERK